MSSAIVAAPTPPPPARTPSSTKSRRGTLSRELALRVAALVAVVAVALGIISYVAVRQIELNQLDQQLQTATKEQDGSQSSTSSPPTGDDGRGLGIPPGGAISDSTSCSYIRQRQWVQLTTEQCNVLAQVPSDHPVTVTIPDIGTYRAQKSGQSVVALPLEPIQSTLKKLLVLEGALTLLAMGGAILLSRRLVDTALRPLTRLASAANDVSALQLDRGEVSLAVRVPSSDADPDSEVGQVGHAFNHMLNNVEGALAARQRSETKVRQFVADASHELRNPLASIRGYAELTRRHRDELPPDTAFAMGRIEAESERMSKLVEDMLLLARLDANPDLDLAPVDVVELVLNAVSDARVAGHSHQWRLHLPEEPVVAQADAFRLHQVVVNLLGNARKHTPEGTIVETAVRAEGPWAIITVADNGPGIDPSIKDSVFERFARADTARAHNSEGSTGLGLAIVSAVMDAHRGTASVQSEPGRTVFTLRLPLSQPGLQQGGQTA